MFSKIVLLPTLLSILSVVTTFGETTNTVKISKSFKEVAKELVKSEESDYSFVNDFYFSGSQYSVYQITDGDGNYSGYFVTDSEQKVLSAYKGTKYPDVNNLESLSPIFAKGTDAIDFDDSYVSAKTASDTDTIEIADTPELNVDLYTSHYDSFSSYQYLTDCPSYYNYSYGPVEQGCAPTSATMLISFYDRYSNMTNLIDGLLPLEHSDNKKAVDKVIVEMAKYMKTDSVSGTSYLNEVKGLTQYLSDKGYGKYGASLLINFTEYATFINTKHNPAMLSIECIKSNGKSVGHSVLGIGVANVRYSGNFMITHYGWKDENEGDYYVSSLFFVCSIYVGKK